MTTPENAVSALSLYRELENEDRKIITFGKIPGAAYFTGLTPAIDTVWPDLDSYTAEHFDEQLSGLTELPVIVMHDDTSGEALAERKETLLRFFMEQHGYQESFSNGYYTVYRP